MTKLTLVATKVYFALIQRSDNQYVCRQELKNREIFICVLSEIQIVIVKKRI